MSDTESKGIEKQLKELYLELKKEYPSLHSMSFDVATLNNGETELFGFYHIRNECEQWKSLDEIYGLIAEARERRAKNKILYHDFSGVL